MVAARAFARISANGTVDDAGSQNIANANVTMSGTGIYCFNNLPFDPVAGVVSAQVSFYNAAVAVPAGSCPGPAQANVAIRNLTGTLVNQPFTVVLY